MEFTAKQIAEFLGGEVAGNENATVSSFAKIEEGHPGALSFLGNQKYAHYLYETGSSIVLVNRDFEPEKPVAATMVKVDNAYESLSRLLTLYESMKPARNGISPLACISDSATIGNNVYIGPFCVVEDGASVGDGTQLYPHTVIGQGASVGSGSILYPHVTIYHGCKVGNNCILHAGSVVGADGFGFAPTAEGYNKIPQIGIVEIQDNVEIGANTCIDRSTMGKTVIGKGVKLDNLVQIGHNVVVGENTVMSSQTGVAGSTKIGSWCTMGGQTGISGHITVGDHVSMGGQTGILGNVKDNEVLMGTPGFDYNKFMRSTVMFRRLPEMSSELSALKKELKELKEKLNNNN